MFRTLSHARKLSFKDFYHIKPSTVILSDQFNLFSKIFLRLYTQRTNKHRL